MSNLCGKRVEEMEVMKVKSPPFTATWHPVSHATVIESLKTSCESIGLGVRSTEYSMNKEGTRMFGVWNLDINARGIGYSLGFRNSIDKSFGIGVCAGTKVFVCSNMCFSGDFIEFKRHTSGLDDNRIIELSTNAVEQTIKRVKKMITWQRSLKKTWLTPDEMKVVAFNMITEGAFSGGKIHRFLNHLDEERALNTASGRTKDTNLYNMHGASTRLMRDWNLLQISKSTKALNQVCDDYIEVKKAA